MLHPRIIPCLLVHHKGLVKTIEFKAPKYLGDPINAVKIFNEKEVDEIIVIDIDATRAGSEPDYHLIENIAIECRMPLCYGGGIKTIAQSQKIFSLGVEKIAVSSLAVENPFMISDIAGIAGRQSVVVVLDIRKNGKKQAYEIYTHNGTVGTGLDPITYARKMEECGAGEIVINSIDNDGKMLGYDLEIIRKVREEISIPLTIMGGAGRLDDMGKVISEFGIVGVAAGSLFVFKGKLRAVLINYPSPREKEEITKRYFFEKWSRN